MNSSFTVSMYLQAYNRMAPALENAKRMMGSMGTTAQNVARQMQAINPVLGWEEKIYRVSEAAKKVGRELRESGKQISEYGQNMQGFRYTQYSRGRGNGGASISYG